MPCAQVREVFRNLETDPVGEVDHREQADVGDSVIGAGDEITASKFAVDPGEAALIVGTVRFAELRVLRNDDARRERVRMAPNMPAGVPIWNSTRRVSMSMRAVSSALRPNMGGLGWRLSR